MDLRACLYGPCYEPADGQGEVHLDVGAFLRRLVLFDRFIMFTNQLQEIRDMVRVFGYEGTRELIRSDAIHLVIEPVTVAQVGNLAGGTLRPDKAVLPSMSFAFATARMADKHDHIHQSLMKHVDPLPLPLRKRIALKQDIVKAIRLIDTGAGTQTLAQLKLDLAAEVPTIRRSLTMVLRDQKGLEIEQEDIAVSVRRIDETDFAVQTNLDRLAGLNDQEQHPIVERALLGLAGLNQRIEEMLRYDAMNGFSAGELTLLEGKFTFLNSQLSPEGPERRFERVVAIAGLPDVNAESRVDVHKLLEVRASDECVAFRQWLQGIDELEDADVAERVASLQARLGSAIHGATGHTVRFLTLTGLGLIPGVNAAVVATAGALDAFVIDRLFPKSGPASFVTHLYPSVFRDGQ
jgi:hypothetical protein